MKSPLGLISSLSCYILFLFGLALSSTAMAGQTEIYKWVDEDGRVHYSSRPGNKSAKKMHFGSKIFHEQKQEENTAESQIKEERAQNCDKAKDRLARYKKAPFLNRYDEKRQQKVRLSEAETKEAFLRVEKDIAYWCNPPTQADTDEENTQETAEAQDTTESNEASDTSTQ